MHSIVYETKKKKLPSFNVSTIHAFKTKIKNTCCTRRVSSVAQINFFYFQCHTPNTGNAMKMLSILTHILEFAMEK